MAAGSAGWLVRARAVARSAQAPRLRSFHFGHILGGFVSFGVRPLASSRFISVLCFFFCSFTQIPGSGSRWALSWAGSSWSWKFSFSWLEPGSLNSVKIWVCLEHGLEHPDVLKSLRKNNKTHNKSLAFVLGGVSQEGAVGVYPAEAHLASPHPPAHSRPSGRVNTPPT